MKSCGYGWRRWFCLVLLAVVGSTGCAGRTEKMQVQMGMLGDTWLNTVIRKNITATGGVELWARLKRIDAEALETLYDAQAGRSLLTTQHVIATQGQPRMQSRSRTAEGLWIEELDKNGVGRMVLEGAVESMPITDVATVSGAALKLHMLRRVMLGGAGLMLDECRLRYAGQERQTGRMAHVVEVTELASAHQDQETLVVLWFDSETLLLVRMWMRYRNVPDAAAPAFGYLSANVSDYKKTKAGLTLPRRIELARSDEHRQFTEQRFVLVEYEGLRILLAEKEQEREKLLGLF